MKTSLRCGYIVLVDNKHFVFFCSLCGSKHTDPNGYFVHVLDFHKLRELKEDDDPVFSTEQVVCSNSISNDAEDSASSCLKAKIDNVIPLYSTGSSKSAKDIVEVELLPSSNQALEPAQSTAKTEEVREQHLPTSIYAAASTIKADEKGELAPVEPMETTEPRFKKSVESAESTVKMQSPPATKELAEPEETVLKAEESTSTALNDVEAIEPFPLQLSIKPVQSAKFEDVPPPEQKCDPRETKNIGVVKQDIEYLASDILDYEFHVSENWKTQTYDVDMDVLNVYGFGEFTWNLLEALRLNYEDLGKWVNQKVPNDPELSEETIYLESSTVATKEPSIMECLEEESSVDKAVNTSSEKIVSSIKDGTEVPSLVNNTSFEEVDPTEPRNEVPSSENNISSENMDPIAPINETPSSVNNTSSKDMDPIEPINEVPSSVNNNSSKDIDPIETEHKVPSSSNIEKVPETSKLLPDIMNVVRIEKESCIVPQTVREDRIPSPQETFEAISEIMQVKEEPPEVKEEPSDEIPDLGRLSLVTEIKREVDDSEDKIKKELNETTEQLGLLENVKVEMNDGEVLREALEENMDNNNPPPLTEVPVPNDTLEYTPSPLREVPDRHESTPEEEYTDMVEILIPIEDDDTPEPPAKKAKRTPKKKYNKNRRKTFYPKVNMLKVVGVASLAQDQCAEENYSSDEEDESSESIDLDEEEQLQSSNGKPEETTSSPPDDPDSFQAELDRKRLLAEAQLSRLQQSVTRPRKPKPPLLLPDNMPVSPKKEPVLEKNVMDFLPMADFLEVLFRIWYGDLYLTNICAQHIANKYNELHPDKILQPYFVFMKFKILLDHWRRKTYLYRKYKSLENYDAQAVFKKFNFVFGLNPSSVYTCPVCQFNLESIAEFKQHFEIVHLDSNHCCFCSTSFESYELLENHIHQEHEDAIWFTTSKEFKCIECGVVFDTDFAFLTHVEKHHQHQLVSH